MSALARALLINSCWQLTAGSLWYVAVPSAAARGGTSGRHRDCSKATAVPSTLQARDRPHSRDGMAPSRGIGAQQKLPWG